MKSERVFMRAAPWPIAVFLGTALTCEGGWASYLRPGSEATVSYADTPEDWRLNNARLVVTPGGETANIDARWNSTVDIDGGTATSRGSAGVLLETSRAVINNATITAQNITSSTSEASFGLHLYRYDTDTGGSSAVVTNSIISGAGRGINAFDGAEVSLVNTTVKGNAGVDTVGPISGGVGMVLGGSRATMSGSTVVGENNGVVIVSGRTGAQSSAASLVVADGSAVVGENGSAILVSAGNAPAVETRIDVANGSTLKGGNGVILEVENAAIATFNVSASQLEGDVLVQEGSTAKLSLDSNASLTGKVTNATSLAIDHSSAWIMQGHSSVNSLLLNGGTVDLRGTTPEFSRLTLGQLEGNGTFAMGTDLAAGESDFLEVTGTAVGSYQLLVQNTGVDPVQANDTQTLVHVAEGDAQFSLLGGKVDFGTYAYQLEQNVAEGGTDWSLVKTDELSESSQAVIGLFSAAPTIWYGESATLRTRMGELRNGTDQGGGWIRSYGNKFNMSAGGGVAYKQVQQGVAFGADAPLPSNEGQWLVGLMGGYSKSDLDLQQGTSGTVDSYYLGAYSTWLADDGFYVDALIKANRFQNHSEVRMSDGEKAKGNYNTAGVGASVEVGKHIKLADDWFVEPFAQVSGLLVGGESYDLDNGMRASSNRADSLLGKAGTQVGRTFTLDDGAFVQPYMKVAAAHEFVSRNRVSINENRFTNDLSGSRVELGAGVAAQMTDVLQLHADVDFMKGRNIEQPWGVSVGVRYSW
ncbi:autotransporter outer membrane beta-barrel domain-containing protein [Pseudomonas sp. CFBP 8772]|uniref:autotransporter outer membrane beta-barrel domain-containing protein n=1 Tax=Pseudomonas sp. CFBP 8772 TaxID=2775284 RepID=UPI00177B2819|nr:autotransporter outer membrane beta-barrel domain-containing protein [Pseudomonas sp. CFBP 8772]MBD8598852.1 autotransporter outer membrane beta-barrel domain-containing protein [Pseudomonas sp. CFBP 8772]